MRISGRRGGSQYSRLAHAVAALSMLRVHNVDLLDAVGKRQVFILVIPRRKRSPSQDLSRLML